MVARYQPGRLGVTLPRSSLYAQLKRGKPRRLRRGGPAPRRLARASRRLPVLRVLLLTVALTAAAMFGGTAARYIKEWANPSLVTAGSFYFASNELDGSLYHLSASGGTAVEFEFTLKNYLVDGYATQHAIPYTCKVEDAAGAAIAGVTWYRSDNTNAGTATLNGTLGSQNGDTGKYDAASTTYRCSIPVTAFDGDRELTVTAAAASPYAVTLTARLRLSTGKVVLRVTDPDDGGASGAVAVTLFNTGDRDVTGTLTWPKTDLELVPDPTWSTAIAADGKLTIPKGEAVSVVFLVKNTMTGYTEDDFSFTENTAP